MESLILPRLENVENNIAPTMYREIIGQLEDIERKPHEFVDLMMCKCNEKLQEIKASGGSTRNLRGTFFEYVVGETLAQSGIRCMYYQADVLHIPGTQFDWFLYHETNPVSISCKTAARDRWKAAALEAGYLKKVYVDSINYLVTIERLAKTEDKIRNSPLTLDHIIQATTTEYDHAIEEIAKIDFVEAIRLSPIRSGAFVEII